MRPLPILKDLSDDGYRRKTRHSRYVFRVDVAEQSSQHNRVTISNSQLRIDFAIRQHGIAADESFDRAVFGMHLRRHAAVASDGRSQTEFHADIYKLNLLAAKPGIVIHNGVGLADKQVRLMIVKR